MRQLIVQSARDLGPQFTANPHAMVGQDGAYSIPLEEGALWFFGDTLIGERTPGESLWYPGGTPVGHADMTGRGGIRRMINNSALILGDRTGSRGLTQYRYVLGSDGEIRPLIPLERGEDPDWTRIWCLHGHLAAGQLYLYYIQVRMLASGPFPVNFEIVGSGLASGPLASLRFERVRRGGSHLLWRWPLPAFASAVLPHPAEGTIYLYGVRKGEGGVQEVCLARVREDLIEDPTRYAYCVSDAPEWGDDPARCRPVFTGAPNELSVSFNRHLGCYLAVHSLDLTGLVVGRTAPHPWGPWGDPVELWSVRREKPHPWPYPPLIYAGKEHPELSGEGGARLYVTYIEFEEYFPHLVEITLR
jgi:hypothetical protein